MENKEKKYELLSYIIPSYNAVKFLEETVESIFIQKLNIPFEVVISDDCSTDGTQELINKLAAIHPQIKYILNKKNRFTPANRNFAISQSQGDLIYMLDHDNILDKGSIQKLINTMEVREREAVTVGEMYLFKGAISDHRSSWIYDFPENLFTIKEYIENEKTPAASNNYMFTRTAFEKTGGYPDRGARENLGFGFRLLATGTPIAVVPNTKYYHRILSSGMWLDEQKKQPQKANQNMAFIFREFLPLFDRKTQKLLMRKEAEEKADSYIKKKKLKLSERGWALAGGKEKYQSRFIKKLKNIKRIVWNQKRIADPTIDQIELSRLQDMSKSSKALNLHIGCGPRILKDWINIDISYEPNWWNYYLEKEYPENIRGKRDDLFIVDITKSRLPFPDKSVELIFSEDFAEHLSQKDFIIFLSETYRILKDGAINRINTPDLIASMKKNSNFKKGFAGVFVNEWNKSRHINILTKNYLNELAEMVGYSNAIFNARNRSYSPDIPPEIRPGSDRNDSEQIFCDLVK